LAQKIVPLVVKILPLKFKLKRYGN